MADERPVLTQQLKMHARGTKFSLRTVEIYADDQPTGILLHTETNGSPHYRYTVRELRFGAETLDLTNPGEVEPMEWIHNRLDKTGGADGDR